ncbi:MAG: class I SAM-dependent methyltransferase [Pseudomonadota bacterium]
MPTLWDERYAGEAYIFGTAPNVFLESQVARLQSGQSALAVADGEGRNGVWLAQQGLQVLSVDSSSVAQAKAKKLAVERGVTLQFEITDLLAWDWGDARFDIIAAIFIQFADPAGRALQFEGIRRALKPGGMLLLQGYTPRQLEYKTGGPPSVENLYTESMLREWFGDWDIQHLREHDDVINEGSHHAGMSALIDLVAYKPEK